MSHKSAELKRYLSIFSRFLIHQRIKTVLPFLQGNILDLGCGAASISEYLKPGITYVGIESKPDLYSWLLDHRPKYQFYLGDITSGNLDLGRRFDSVLMLAVLEHLQHPMPALELARSHLEKSGALILTTPTPLGMRVHTILARLGVVSSHAADEHQQAITHSALNRLISNAGMRLTHSQKFLLGGNHLFVCTPYEKEGYPSDSGH